MFRGTLRGLMLFILSPLLLSACGGGGGATPPAPETGPVTTDLQAKTLAARSANAMFAYDNMNSDAFYSALFALPVGAGFASGNYAALCSAGSGRIAFNDADASGAVSVGDVATLAASACQPFAQDPWIFSGTVPVSVLGGVNVERHLYLVDVGSAQLGVTHAGTAIGGNRTATGTYSILESNTVNNGPFDQTINMPNFTIAHANVNLLMTGLSFAVTSSGSLSVAAGSFDTSVAGVGNVQLALSVKTPLTVNSSTGRFRPSAGSLTLTASNFSFDVEYGAGGTVTIRVDNARDGTVDRTVVTSESELDTLLTNP